MFTKIGVTVASGVLPVLLWAGAASAQQSPQSPETTANPCSQSQSQSQSQCTTLPVSTIPQTTGDGGGTLARTGAEDLVPLALGGVALAGAVAVRGFRRRSVI